MRDKCEALHLVYTNSSLIPHPSSLSRHAHRKKLWHDRYVEWRLHREDLPVDAELKAGTWRLHLRAHRPERTKSRRLPYPPGQEVRHEAHELETPEMRQPIDCQPPFFQCAARHLNADPRQVVGVIGDHQDLRADHF